MKTVFETPYLALGLWPRRLLLAAVLAGALAYSALLGAVAGSGSMLRLAALVALPAGLVGLAIAGHYFRLMVLVLPATALFLPFLELGTGTASRLPASLLLTLGLMAIWVAGMYRRGWSIAPSPINRPLLSFAVICVVSLVWGIAWRDPGLIRWAGNFNVTQLGALAAILASLFAGLLVGNFVNRRGQIVYLFALFIVAGALMTASQMAGLSQRLLNDRGLWSLWFAAPLLGVAVMQPGLRWYWRAALLALLAVHLQHVVIANSLWISGWLPTLVGLGCILFLHSPRLFFVALVIVALSGGPWISAYIQEVAHDNIEEGGLERLELWRRNFQLVGEHWLLGTGPAGYAIYYMTYFRDDARSTHNNYMDVLSQFGALGLGAWLWLCAASLREGWRLTRAAPPGLLRTAAAVATGGWLAGLASMMIGDWILPFAYNQGIGGFKYTVYSWIFFGLLIAVRQILVAEERAAEEDDDEPLLETGATR